MTTKCKRRTARKPGYSIEHDSWTIPLTRGVVALVDADMVPVLAQHNWYANHAVRQWVAMRALLRPDGGHAVELMHRLVISAPAGVEVDHREHYAIDARLIDNRHSNLRLCTTIQNSGNRRPNANGTSRYKGVVSTPGGKWSARIRINGKKTYLGTFTDELAAARAYDDAALEHFGEFARPNLPDLTA